MKKKKIVLDSVSKLPPEEEASIIEREFVIKAFDEICKRLGLPLNSFRGKPISKYTTKELSDIVIFLRKAEKVFIQFDIGAGHQTFTEFIFLVISGKISLDNYKIDLHQENDLERMNI